MRSFTVLVFMVDELPTATWKERLFYFFGRRIAFMIEGNSMAPMLVNGDAVLIDPHGKTEVGDIVLARHPYKQSIKIVKRVREIDADQRYFLTGDNEAESTDSRTFGLIPSNDILGKAVCRLK